MLPRLVTLLALGALALAPAVAAAERAHFHHVHLNVVDPERTVEFYEQSFGAQPLEYRGRAEALYTERSWLLLQRVASPPRSGATTGLWHIGWGGADVPAEARWLEERGVEVHTPLYRIPGSEIWVTYWRGPDGEMIEVNTMGHRRFGHVHLLAVDVNATTTWYRDHLGVEPRRDFVPEPASWQETRAWSNGFRVDNVSFVVYGLPRQEPLPPWWQDPPRADTESTRGHVLDHLAFSYRDIEPVLERMRADGVTIVEPIAMREELGVRSFFVEGPDRVLIEIVEEPPIPQGIWQQREP